MGQYLIYLLLIAGTALSIVTKKLTVTGAITAGVIGLLVFEGGSYTGLGMLVLFFIAGTVATGFKAGKKQELGVAEKDKGKRTAGQVIANGGVAAVCGGLAWCFPQYDALLQLMMAGSLASATADTLSSELGTIYGSTFYDILTFQEAEPGPDGVISMEGTLIGIIGAALIAFVYAFGYNSYQDWLIIILAGVIGNLADSLLGATLERGKFIGNNGVNFLNTLTGTLICLLLAQIISK